jgi:hypothetical protein
MEDPSLDFFSKRQCASEYERSRVMRRLMLWLEPSLPKNTWVAKVLSMSSGGADIQVLLIADGIALI